MEVGEEEVEGRERSTYLRQNRDDIIRPCMNQRITRSARSPSPPPSLLPRGQTSSQSALKHEPDAAHPLSCTEADQNSTSISAPTHSLSLSLLTSLLPSFPPSLPPSFPPSFLPSLPPSLPLTQQADLFEVCPVA